MKLKVAFSNYQAYADHQKRWLIGWNRELEKSDPRYDFLEYLTRMLHKAATIKVIRFAEQKEDEAEFADMFKS